MPFKSEKQRKYLWKEPSGDSAEVGEPVQESNETAEGFSPIKEVTEQEVKK